MSREIGRVLEGVDVAAVIDQLLAGRTLQINAEFKLTDQGTAGKTAVEFSGTSDEGDGRNVEGLLFSLGAGFRV